MVNVYGNEIIVLCMIIAFIIGIALGTISSPKEDEFRLYDFAMSTLLLVEKLVIVTFIVALIRLVV